MMYYMAAVMKSAKPVLLLPDAFREKIAFHQINPVGLLQAYINIVHLFDFMRAVHDNVLDQKVFDIHSGMTSFLKKKGEQAERDLFDLCGGYLERLNKLIPLVTLSKNKKKRIANQIIRDWEQEVGKLLNYPRTIQVEDLGELHISFNYFVVCAFFRISLVNDLSDFMEMAGTDESSTPKKINLYQTNKN